MRASHGVAARAVRAPSNKRVEKTQHSQSNHAKFEDGEVEAHQDGMLGEDHEAEALGSKASLRQVSPPSSGGDDLAARIRDAARGEDGKSPRDRMSSSDQDTSRASLYKQGSIHFKNTDMHEAPKSLEEMVGIGKTWPFFDRLIEDYKKKTTRRYTPPVSPADVNSRFERNQLMPELPSDESEILKHGPVYKSTGEEATVSARTMVVTPGYIYIARKQSRQVLDRIHANIISSVDCLQPQAANSCGGANIRYDVETTFTGSEKIERSSSTDSELAHYTSSHKAPGVGANYALRTVVLTQELETADFFNFGFEIHTTQTGIFSSLTYRFYAETEEERDEWISQIQNIIRIQRARLPTRNVVLVRRYQLIARALYQSNITQFVIAFLISANFIFNARQAEVGKVAPKFEQDLYESMDDFFTAIFALELAWNATAHWFWDFLNAWNVFDTIVVLVSIISRLFDNVPGLNTLRLLRAFRVLRLFGRLASLRRIINALMMSIGPVANAFLIMLLVIAIYSILAVEFFSEWVGPEPEFFPVGDFFFGTFSKSMFSLFQIITGDSWSSGIVRFFFAADGSVPYGPATFFISFIVLVAWTLLQVVVALLLDNFNSATAKEKEEEAAALVSESDSDEVRVLDPVLAQLSHFDTDYDLKARINLLFAVIDHDDSETLDYEKLAYGLHKLEYEPPVQLTQHDYKHFTGGKNGVLDSKGFEMCMRRELKLYGQRQMQTAMVMDRDSELAPIMIVFKLLLNATQHVTHLDTQTVLQQLARASSQNGSARNLRLNTNVDLSTPRKLKDPKRMVQSTITGGGFGSFRAENEPAASQKNLISGVAPGGRISGLEEDFASELVEKLNDKLDDLHFKVNNLSSNISNIMRRLDEDASNRVPDKLDRIATVLGEMGSRLQKLEERGGGSTARIDANTHPSIASSLGFFSGSQRENRASTPVKDPTRRVAVVQPNGSSQSVADPSLMWKDLSGGQGPILAPVSGGSQVHQGAEGKFYY